MTNSKTELHPETAARDLEKHIKFTHENVAIKARCEAEHAAVMSEIDSPTAIENTEPLGEKVTESVIRIAIIDRLLKNSHRQQKQLLTELAPDIDHRAARAAKVSARCFDRVVATVKEKLQPVAELFGGTDELGPIIARTVPVKKAAARRQQLSIKPHYSMTFIGGVPVVSPDENPAVILSCWKMAKQNEEAADKWASELKVTI